MDLQGLEFCNAKCCAGNLCLLAAIIRDTGQSRHTLLKPAGLICYMLPAASIRFLAYGQDMPSNTDGVIVPLKAVAAHLTKFYKLQEMFNNVSLPCENVFRGAIAAAAG